MPIDLEKYAPTDPSAPKVLDLDKCRKFVAGAGRYSRLPVGDMIQEIADQINLLLAEVGSAGGKVSAAQGDAIRYQREAELAAGELMKLRPELLAAKEEIRLLKAQLSKESVVTSVAATRKKRGPKAKVVQLSAEAKAQ